MDSNTGKVRIRLRVVVAERETSLGHRVTYEMISRDTGLSPSTISLWMRDQIRFIDVGTLGKLCGYLQCQPGDLIEFIPEVKDDKKKVKRRL